MRDIEALFAMLAEAERLLVIAGGSGWGDEAREKSCSALPLQADCSVVTTFRRRDIIDHRLSVYAGEIGIGSNPALPPRSVRATSC